MNKAITEGLDLMPPAFIDGLTVWSSQDGTPGSATYATDPNGTLVASDQDFGPCIEIFKADSPQKLRYMGETPILPGTYLEVSARVKLMSGPYPQVRIAAFAGDANGNPVTGVDLEADTVSLDETGRIYTVRAIIGSGSRTGVDLVWGTTPVFGHVGIDITGDNGAVVRVESIRVEDKTSVFYRKLMDWVDVRDYGAIGDAVTDDADAFETADAAAAGREVVVPAGSYYLSRNVTMLSPVRFEGTVTQPDDKHFVLRANFDYPSYVEAFGDETLALKKALQALFNYTDHDALDLGGRRIELTEPIDVYAAVGGVDDIYTRRAIRNGQFSAENTPAWNSDVVTANANYSPSDKFKLTNVSNINAIQPGSLVEGFGVGREIYVVSVNTSASELTLSQPLYRANASQSYTFTRFKYMLDFSGFSTLRWLNIDAIEFRGNKRGSGIMLPQKGPWVTVRNCWFIRPGDRGITSIFEGCQGLTIDNCEFLAPDASEFVQDRTSIGFNTNKNDPKLRNNRCIDFKHFGVISGSGNLILGNHVWQADSQTEGEKTAGIVLTDRKSKSTITGNYWDTQFIEITNEHAADATSTSGLDFGRISIVGNIFTATEVPDWFRFIVLAPIGTNHKIDGISVIGNTFQLFDGAVIDRVEGVDTALGNFNYAEVTDLVFDSNTYSSVTNYSQSPALLEVTRSSTSTTWTADASGKLPFGCYALGVDAVQPHGEIQTGSNATYTGAPWVLTQKGSGNNQVQVKWDTAVKGSVQLRVRADKPVA